MMLLFLGAWAQDPAPPPASPVAQDPPVVLDPSVVQDPPAVQDSATEPGLDPQPSVPVPESQSLRLLWTGGKGGIGSGTYAFPSMRSFDAEVTAVRPVHGWLAQGSWRVAAESARVEDVLTMMAGTGPTCTRGEAATLLRTPHEEVLLTAALEAVAGETVQVDLWSCEQDGITGVLHGPAGADAPTSWDVTTWEFRKALRLTVGGVEIDSIGVPIGEGARLFKVLEDAASKEHVLYMDAGDFVDGASSVRNDALSLHRPAGFAMLRRLQPEALAPGANELVGGARSFLDESSGLPYIATNWRSDDPALALPDRRVVEVNGVRVGLVAALDPVLMQQIPQLEKEGIHLEDPVESVQAVVDELAPEVDLVVLLTTATRALDSLRSELLGVHLVVGDVGAHTDRMTSLQVTLREEATGPLMVPADGIVAAELEIREGLRSLRAVPLRVPASVQPDLRTQAAVSAVRAREYPPLDHPLLPSPDPTEILDEAVWSKAVCEAILDHTDADVALLDDPPPERSIPGAVTELVAADWLATSDRIEVHHVPGTTMRRLLDQLYGIVPLACGSELGVKFPKAKGRPLEDERLYRVAVSDRLAASTGVGSLLQGARSNRVLDRPGYRVVQDDDHAEMTLRTITLEAMRSLRDKHGPAVIDTLVARSSKDRRPQWLLRARELSFRVEGFRGAGDDRYAEVPETLATSPSSFTLGSGVDLALDYSSAQFNWDLRGRSAYVRLDTDGESQETADDIKLSMSSSLPGIHTPVVGGFAFSPFAEALLDSEWTRGEAADQRQADLSMTLGLAARRQAFLRVFRVGGLVNKDMAVLPKRPEFGGRLEVQTYRGFGPGIAWTNQLDAFVFADTPDQDASDLRFKAQLDTRFNLPLARWLGIAVYGGGFVFQGRAPTTQSVRWSGSVGAALDLTGAFQL